ncbi:type II and III secretion system protein family protein [Vibrio rarus]|uniref:type II and III secretion system protein family protein n=1 Tax=Vibrio rarus TaxID=413403 RepID=UPI0021C48239|nr:pilus assembly protein N-terminal domain-containing protein [Vibrio rarus]
MTIIARIMLAMVVSLTSLSALATTMNLQVGQAQSLSSRQAIGSVFVVNPKVADYKVIDNNKLVVYGKKEGDTSLLVFNHDGQTLISRKVHITQDLSYISQQIKMRYPHSQVTVSSVGSSIVLSGNVSSDAISDGIYQLVGSMAQGDGKATASSDKHTSADKTAVDQPKQAIGHFVQKKQYPGVVNNIEVILTRQVNVKLTIAEVTHDFAEKLGVQVGSGGQMGVFVDHIENFSASDITSVISAVNSEDVGQILAEPNLSVISGEKANFMVGGELPIVYSTDDNITVDFKKYGVNLELQALVERDDKIKLLLHPEVSSIDEQHRNDKFDIPALKTRSAETTVELGDGQSFILGGLLDSQDVERLKKIPFVSEIPIIGALFRHTESERNKTELIIVATVNLVHPIDGAKIQLPTMRKTHTLERWLGVRSSQKSAGEQWGREILAAGGFKK